MRKRTFFKCGLIMGLAVLVIAPFLFAQGTNTPVGEPDPGQIGIDTAQQELKEVSVSKMEDAGMWTTQMSSDKGLVTVRRIEGSPIDKEPIPAEEEIGFSEEDKYVLGVKIQFYKRGMTEVAIQPAHPMPVEGITKTVSLWAIGRNTNHRLKLIISDYFGNRAEINMGKLNFSGWKKLTVAIPSNILQRDYHYNNKMGIKIEGFRLECEPEETYGTYYLYLDDIRATTDLFSENNRDPDDIQDAW